MSLVSPYRNIKQSTRVAIEARQMNSDIRNNMKINLKKQVEKKCNKNGYVDEVYRIVEYSDGYMPPENLNGSAIYNIVYHCKICIPVENTIIIVQVKVINPDLIVGTNGPIMVFVSKENIDANTWSIEEGLINKLTKTKLKIQDYVKVQLINKRVNQGDGQIKAIGKLLEIATEEEVDKYFGSKIVKLEEETITEENASEVKEVTEKKTKTKQKGGNGSNFIL
jgi:DNA-directed RNA polymerase subunit E'/Rpb7